MTIKMKPFDLERALAGDPVVTRGGRKVLKLAYFPELDSEYQIYAQTYKNIIDTYTKDGHEYIDQNSNDDLFMLSNSKTYWMNVYEHKLCSQIFETQEEAKEYIHKDLNYIDTVSFELEEE